MTYSALKDMIDNYNWDDGFIVPTNVLKDPNCDLALALEIFYLGDGYGYLTNAKEERSSNPEWLLFIENLYCRIEKGQFAREENDFQIPLNKAQIHKIRTIGVPEVFLDY